MKLEWKLWIEFLDPEDDLDNLKAEFDAMLKQNDETVMHKYCIWRIKNGPNKIKKVPIKEGLADPHKFERDLKCKWLEHNYTN